MLKPILAALALLTLGLTACGSAADNPPAAPGPAAEPVSVAPAVAESSAAAEPVVPAAPLAPAIQPAARQAQPAVPAAAAANPGATANPEPAFDDARVEGLVAEWETDLALIAQVADCVERELGLERPLQPEDFQLQAHQPAIVACVAKEVGNE